MPQRIELPPGQEPTPEFVQSEGARLGVQASPQRQAQAQNTASQAQPSPSFPAALAGAVSERTVGPLATLTTPPRSLGDLGEKALAGLGAVGTGAAALAAPWMTAGIMGGGALLQAGMESTGTDKDTAQLLSGLVEMGAGGVAAAKHVYTAGSSLVRKGAKAFTKLASAEGTPQMNVARALTQEADATIKRTAEPLKAVFEGINKAAEARKLPFNADSGAAGYFQDAVEWARDNGIPMGPRTKKLLKVIQKDMVEKGTTPLSNVLKLRSSIVVPPKLSADADAGRKLIKGFKRRVTQSIETAMPADMRTEWDTARNGWRDGVAGPRRVLNYILNKDTPASSAFTRIFDTNHPEAFQMMTKLAGKSPAARIKLRLGYLETLRKTTQDFENTKELVNSFNQSRPMMASTGLFSSNEMDELSTLIRRGALARSNSKFHAILTGLAIGGSGAAGYLQTRDPGSAIIAALAGGAASQVRMLSLLPLNSPQAKLLGATVGRQITNAAKAVNSEYSTVQPEDVDDDDF